MACEDADRGLSFGSFYLLNLGCFGVGLGDFHLLLVDLGLDAHAVILLFLQQQRLEALRRIPAEVRCHAA